MAPKKFSNKRNRKQKPERFDNNNSGGLAETFAETGLDTPPLDTKIEKKCQPIPNNISLEQRFQESDKKVKNFLKNLDDFSKTRDLGRGEQVNFLKASSTKSSNFDMAEENGSSDFTITFLDELVELTKLQLELGLARHEILAQGQKFALKKLARIIKEDADEELRDEFSGKTEDDDKGDADFHIIGSDTESTDEASAATVPEPDSTVVDGSQNEIESKMDEGNLETQKSDVPTVISGDLYKEIEEFLENLDI